MKDVSDSSATRVLPPRAGGPEVLAVRRARVTVLRGRDAGKQVDLGERQSLTIGTDPECDLVLADDSVSRRHAEVVAEPNGYRLRDLGSTNGLRIAGTRVGDLYFGDKPLVVSIGETDLECALFSEEVQHELSAQHRFGLVIGRTATMRQMFALLERASATDSTVLLEGESGTGKEVIAESVHRASPRKSGPFMVVDCSAIPANLIESELFGHEKGAFTGAVGARAGAFEEADGGTLFLDEVGELPSDLQPKFLRALERRQIKRVGATQYKDVDVRIVAATNRDLGKLVGENRFRSDLYYRLAVVKVAVPPLRHHLEDVPVLARHFVTQIRPGTDPFALLTGAVLAAFSSYSWPGNVRELRNAVERLLAIGEIALSPAGVAPSASSAAIAPVALVAYHDSRRLALDHFEREYCRALLADCGGVVVRAAERAGISRQMFHRLMKRHGVEGGE
jgi:two-component system, NtrC family, response regulator GlrR